jgi:ankyrin repeat protein
MKRIVTLIFLAIAAIGFSQDYKKIIDKNDIDGLTKLINKETEFYGEVHSQELDLSIHPMVYAAAKNNLNMVKVFVKNQDKIDDYHTVLSKSFSASIATSNDELITYLYSLEPNINERCESCSGHTAIMIAAVYGNDKWYFKLKPKSELNLLSDTKNNLLHLSCNQYNKSIFEDILTIEGLDINQINSYGRTPLQQAAIEGKDTIYFKIKELGGEYNKLHDFYYDAIIGGKVNIFNDLPENDFLWQLHEMPWDDDAIEYYPIETAISYNSTEITKVLFDQMFKTLNNNKNERTEIMVDILNGRDAIGDVLALLWEAVNWENKELFEIILKNTAKFNNLELKYTRYQEDIDEEFNEVAIVQFTKFENRAAKRKFGKEFVDALYEKHNIEF